MNSIVVGVNSFLGKTLCKQLLDKGDNVIGAYHKNTTNLLERCTNINMDNLFKLTLTIDVVYIVSAYVPSKNDTNIETRLNEVNVEFVKRICDKFNQSKIVYCSTISVYKESDQIITEQSEVLPGSLYGKSKRMGELIVMNQANYSIVRISSMFGVGMKETTFLPAIIKNAIQNKKINLLGSGSRMQNYVSVKNVANYLIKSSLKENNIYLATHTKSYSNKDIGELIQAELKSVDLTFSGVDESKSYQYDNSFSRTDLKIKDIVNFTESLKELIEWQVKMY